MKINESNYVDKAEQAIKDLIRESERRNHGKANILTTSQIRNLLAMTVDIYNQVTAISTDVLDAELSGRVEYLRVRFVYESGREPKVRELVKKAEILEILKEIKQSKKNYLLFGRYMEALVAFRKYYGPRERD